MGEYREFVEKMKYYFRHGKLQLTHVQSLLEAGKITQEEYDYIVGESEEVIE